MILVGLGANLSSRYGEPEETFRVAQSELRQRGVRVVKQSSVWKSAPVPASDQPWYRNAVIAVETSLSAAQLLSVLQAIEHDFGRIREERNAARILDMDLLAYDDQLIDLPNMCVPHPRMHERAFVLMPLQEIAPEWFHPETGLSLNTLIKALPQTQKIERVVPSNTPKAA